MHMDPAVQWQCSSGHVVHRTREECGVCGERQVDERVAVGGEPGNPASHDRAAIPSFCSQCGRRAESSSALFCAWCGAALQSVGPSELRVEASTRSATGLPSPQYSGSGTPLPPPDAAPPLSSTMSSDFDRTLADTFRGAGHQGLQIDVGIFVPKTSIFTGAEKSRGVGTLLFSPVGMITTGTPNLKAAGSGTIRVENGNVSLYSVDARAMNPQATELGRLIDLDVWVERNFKMSITSPTVGKLFLHSKTPGTTQTGVVNLLNAIGGSIIAEMNAASGS